MPPVIAAIQAIGALIPGIAAATTAATVAGTLIIASAAMAIRSLIPKVDMGVVDTDRSRQTTVRSTIEPRKLVYGETMISGVVSFAQVDGANNKNLHQVIAIAGHKLTSIDKIFFDDYSIDLSTQVDGNGDVTSGKFAKKTNESGTLETMVHIETRDGSLSQTAYSNLVTAFAGTGANSGKGYETTHKGNSVASIYTRWTIHEGSAETWDEVGGIQNIKAVVKGKAVYDPRLDVAAGNDAGDNPTTAAYIKYSDGATTATHQRDLQGQNPALMLADYLMDSTFGLGLPASKIDWPAVVTAADACDFLVPIPVSQTQKRFFGSGVIFGSDNHRKSISKILSGMNGDLIYSQGKYIIKAGVHQAATADLAFTEDDIAGEFTVKTSIPRADRFNTIKGMFIDPESNYKMTEFSPRTVSGAVARDNGEVLEEEIKLTFTSDRYVAQRLAIKKVNQSFLQTTLSLPVNLKGMKVAVGDRITLALNDFATIDADWNPSKEFKVVGWSFSESGNGAIDLSLIEDDSARYADPAEGEYNQISNTGVITTSLADVPLPTGFTATAGYNSVNLAWTNPTNTGAWEQIWIYASDTTTPPATPIEKFRGTSFTHQIAGGTVKYYWIQAVKYPLGATPAAGATNTAKSALVPFGSPTAVTALKIANAVMASDSIDTAQIIDDAVGSAQIAQTLQSDNYSVQNQTGWEITKSGDATFNNAVVRGNISATTGSVGGFTISSTDLIAGDGATRVSLSTDDGISLGNNTFASAPFRVTRAGALTATGATITGAITATSGTFTGTVNASAGAFTGDVSTDSKFIAGSGATSATMDGGDQNYKFYAGAATAGASPFKVDASGTVTADRIVITRPNDPSAVIFDSAQDGLVGVGLASLASGSDTAVAQVADELTSNTDYARTILSATQSLTIKTLFPLGYLPFAINSAEDFPDSITLTLQVANINGGVVGTFANVSLGSKTFTRRTLSGAASDDNYYSVYASGTGWYAGDKDAIDSQFNLVMSKTFVSTPGDRAYRVQVSYVAGSGSSTANPSSSSSRTLYFNSSSQYFTIDSSNVIRDQAAGSLLTGDVILTASSGSRSISWRDSDTQDETFTIEAKPDINESGSNTLNIKYNNGTSQPFAFVGDNGNFLASGSIYADGAASNSTQWKTGYDYSQIGHLPLTGGTISQNLTITGDLTVNGTTTTVNTDNLTVKDNNITLNYSTGDSSSTANDAGITIQDAVSATADASILWKTASDSFEFSHNANIPKTYLKATDQDAESGTWTSSTTGASWGTIKLAAGYSYTYNAGAYKQYNIPAGADTCYMSLLKWSDGGYVDVHAIQADGDLVFLGRISTGQSVETSNEGDPAEHDGQAIVKIGTGLSSFSSIRITNKRGSFYFTGLAFSTQELDNFDSGMIAAETLHSGVLSNVTNTNWDAAYTYSQVGHLPLAGGTLTGGLSGTTGTFSGAITATNLDINKNVTTTSANGAFDVSKSLLGNIHITNGAGASGSPKEAAITFQGGSANEAQAGIYVVNDNSTGTHMALATTNSYAAGPQIAINITNAGVVNFPRGRPTYNGNGLWASSDFSSTQITQWDTAYSYSQVGHLPLTGGTLTGNLAVNPSSTVAQINVGDSSQTDYTNLLLHAADGTGTQNGQMFKASDTYTNWGGADSLNIYNSKGTINFHPAGQQDRFVVESGRVYTKNAYLLVGNNGTTNSYATVATGRIYFGGLNTSYPDAYSIGVGVKEDVGGDYTKLDIQWHTGIRIGANETYGGTRFYNDAMADNTPGVKIFSVGELDNNVRVYYGLNVSGQTNLTDKLDVNKASADSIIDIRGNGNFDSVLNLRSDQGAITTEGFQIWYDNNVGDVHLHTTYPNDAAAIRFHTATGTDKATNNERFTINGNGLINIVSGNLAMGGQAVISPARQIYAKTGTQVGEDGTYGGYGVIGFGGITNGYNRVFGRDDNGDGLFLASATGRGVYVRTNGAGSDTFGFTSAGAFQVGGTTVIDSSRNLSNIGTINGTNLDQPSLQLVGSAYATLNGAKSQFGKGAAAGSSQWDTHVYSTTGYKSGVKMEYSPATLLEHMAGISTNPSASASYTNINYAWYVAGSTLYIYESGTSRGAFGTVAIGDKLSIIYDNTNAYYYHNNVLKRTVAVGANVTFHFDTALLIINVAQYNYYAIFEPFTARYEYPALKISATSGSPFEVLSSSAILAGIKIGNATQTSYSSLILTAEGGNTEIFKGSSTYTNWGGANSLNLYTSSGLIAFHPSGNSSVFRVLPEGIDTAANKTFVINGAVSPQTINTGTHSLVIKNSGSNTAGGLVLRSANDTHLMQLYGANGSDFGFLESAWGSWDLRKTRTGNLYLNNSSTWYLNTTGNSAFAGATYGGLSIGEAPVNYASWDRQLTLNGTGHARMHVKTTAGIQMGMYAHDTWLNSGGGYLGTYTNNNVTFIINAASAGYIDTSKRFTWQHAMLIGGEWTNNSYNAVSSTSLAFGGGNDLNNYSIGTSMENVGGNYTKLNIKWHTGIRFFVLPNYGGVRFFSDAAMSTELMSIGNLDSGVRITGRLHANGGLSQDGHTLINGTDTWYRTNNNDGIYFSAYTGGVHMEDSTWVRTYNNKRLYVGGGSAEIATTGNVTAYYSDMRLKTKTADIDNALEKVNSLSGFKYVENDLAKELGYSNDKQQVGLSAQQIQAVLPEAVSLAPIDMDTDENTGEITSKSGENYLTVDYSKLVPLLVEAIKELTQEVETLKTKLKEK